MEKARSLFCQKWCMQFSLLLYISISILFRFIVRLNQLKLSNEPRILVLDIQNYDSDFLHYIFYSREGSTSITIIVVIDVHWQENSGPIFFFCLQVLYPMNTSTTSEAFSCASLISLRVVIIFKMTFLKITFYLKHKMYSRTNFCKIGFLKLISFRMNFLEHVFFFWILFSNPSFSHSDDNSSMVQ